MVPLRHPGLHGSRYQAGTRDVGLLAVAEFKVDPRLQEVVRGLAPSLCTMATPKAGKVLYTNVMGAWYCIKHAIPQMQRQGRGVIINVNSVAAFHGKGSSMAYAASKAALTSLTRSLARAFGPTVRVNNLAPGLVETDFVDWPPV